MQAGCWGLPLRHPQRSRHLTSVGSDLVYAGSFGLGLFRSEDRGAIWTKSGQGVTDPFILTLTTGKDGAIYAGTFRGGVFRSRDRGKSWQAINSGFKHLEIKARPTGHCLPEPQGKASCDLNLDRPAGCVSNKGSKIMKV